MTERICPTCGTSFVPNRPHQKWCEPKCGGLDRQARYRKAHPPPSIERACRYCEGLFSSHDGRQHYCSEECSRTAKSLVNAKWLYGISRDEYRAAWLRQKGVCAICKQPERTERNRLLTIDHDHVSGQIRGLLCSQCNRAIGLLNDDPRVILAAAEYVKKHRQLRLL